MILRIKCVRCGGACWEEDLPETPSIIDIVCLSCSERKHYRKVDYFKWKDRLEKKIAYRQSAKRREVPS